MIDHAPEVRLVLRVLTRPNLGGPARQAVALWHAHRALGVRTVIAVGACGPDERALDLTAAGIPELGALGASPPAARGTAQARGAADAGGWVRVPGLRRRLAPLDDLRAFRRLRALIRATAPQVVHTHTTKAGWLGRWAARREGVPVVAHTFHGHVLTGYYPEPVGAVLARLERAAAVRADLLFAVSETCREELAARRVAERRRIAVLPPAVELAPFRRSDRAAARGAARHALGLPEHAAVLGFVGRLVPIKRVDLFLELLRRLAVRPAAGASAAGTPADGASADAVFGAVFGDGPMRERVRARARREPRVLDLGAREDLAALLPAVDLLVLPSEREGLPLAGVEAVAAGVPVLGFDVPGVADLLRATGAGRLVPRTAGVEGLLAAARAMLSERGPRPPRRRAERWLARCSPERVAAELLERYRRAGAQAASVRTAVREHRARTRAAGGPSSRTAGAEDRG